MTFKELIQKWQIGPGMNDKDGLYSGFDGVVGDGWVPLLDRLITDLVALGWGKKVFQIKEKFGTLRFYASYTSAEMSDRIREAELESAKTCEQCGRPGRLRTDRRWTETICDECDNEFARKKEPDDDDIPLPPTNALHVRWAKINKKWQCFYTTAEHHDAATCKWCNL